MRIPLLLAMTALVVTVGAEDQSSIPQVPKPRPRLTDVSRAKAEDIARKEEIERSGALLMDKMIVKGVRLRSGPPKEEETDAEFSPARGGYLLKKTNKKFQTELGLWHHLDMMDDEMETLTDITKVRMGILRIRW